MAHDHLIRWRWSGAAVLSGLLLTGCGASEGPLKSLDDPDASVIVCTPQELGTGLAVIAINDFQVTGDSDVVVTDVSLVEAEGLELVGFELGDPHQDPEYRLVGGDYETDGPPDIPQSFTLESGTLHTLKVGLRASPDGGATDALSVTYEVAGTHDSYSARTSTRLQIAGVGMVCTP